MGFSDITAAGRLCECDEKYVFRPGCIIHVAILRFVMCLFQDLFHYPLYLILIKTLLYKDLNYYVQILTYSQ
jgi:hypothetical protein